MSGPPKAPPVYRPTSQKVTGPPVYRPQQTGKPGVQLKPAGNFRTESRPAPPVYRPGQHAVLAAQPKLGTAANSAQSQLRHQVHHGVKNAGAKPLNNTGISITAKTAPIQQRPYPKLAGNGPAVQMMKKRKVKEIEKEKEEEPKKKEKLSVVEYVAVDYGSRESNQGAKIHIIPKDWEEQDIEGNKLSKMYTGFPEQIRKARSYASEREKQILRWLANVVFQKFGGVEIQCYWDASSGNILISSNTDAVNNKIRDAVKDETLIKTISKKDSGEHGRVTRHRAKLFVRDVYKKQEPLKAALDEYKIVVPDAEHKDYDLHAERRIREKLGKDLDPTCLGGVKRPCMVCAHALKLAAARRGPLWTTKSALGGLTIEGVLKHALENGLFTYVTFDKIRKKLTINYDTDSESEEE